MIFFGSIFEFSFFLYLAINYLKLNYPDQFNKLIVCTSYNLIYYFSFAQIKFTKLLILVNDKYFDFIKSNPQLLEYINKLKKTEQIKNTVEYILDSSTIVSDKKPDEFDFIIYNDTNSINKFVSHGLLCDNVVFKETSYNFVLCEITVSNKTVKIDFKTQEYNFMLVNNIINANFINYFIKKYYNCDEISETIWFDYTLKILDQNVNEIILDASKELVLADNSYTVNELYNISNKIISLNEETNTILHH